ncbi:four helix bundle protein [Seonamhaeicola aphaedonensis]|uniref:Four helix bundle protein n=1 Tax=Seonamhaeicola aphaedonensis TaxID=1461338 RepID=A0A3D9H6Z8_9FLAO|nr:four helix bundle protein [Seonamhaeicola aphaedonensis]RED44931.1 four helix bundle protein [Seonamhaeicola aphaedonensis]
MKSYRDLIVWQKSIDLVTLVYKLVKQFPEDEKYSLISQLKRSSISIPSNIAEGYGRKYTNDYARFLQISRGSLFEMQTQLQIAVNLEFIDKDDLIDVVNLSVEIEKMLNVLIKKLAN